MIIRDILQLKGNAVHSIAPEGKVRDAVAAMAERDIGSLVVTAGGRMVGMLTFREVLQALCERGGNLGEVAVGEIMATDPIRGNPGDTLEHLREAMTRHHVRYLPVLDGERLVGVVSFHDVAKAVIKETHCENRLLRRYIESSPEAGQLPPE